MPLPTIAGTVRISVKGSVPSSQQWTNVWHARFTGGASSPGLSDLTALDTLFARFYTGTAFGSGSAWLVKCSSTVALSIISYLILDGTSLGVDISHPAAGTGGVASSPSECAPVVTLRTAQRGRSHRGRVYLPCPVQGQIGNDGRLLPAAVSSTIAQLSGLMTALGGPSVAPFWELGVASYKYGYFTPLNLPSMDGDIDVQRRRKK